MGKIQLIRIDDRLIHGQVMTKWSKGLGINALYIVDDEVAKDDFMKMIYINSNSSAGLTIKVYSIQEVIDEWVNHQFKTDTAILLFKSIKAVEEAYQQGLPIKELNIGGLAKKGDSQFVITSVAINKDDLQRLKGLSKKDVNVYFQTVPDTKKVTIADAIKQFK